MNKKLIVTIFSLFVLSGLLFNCNKGNKVLITDKQIKESIIGVYLESDDGSYTKSDTIPQSGYKLNSSKSTCNNNVTPTWSSKGLKLSYGQF